MYRLQDNVPEYLINESRDFQLLCRLYDCVNNGVKFSIDSIVRLMDTTSCGSGFLKLLETRLGFFTNNSYTDDEIRDVLLGFCDAVKYKGSLIGIERAVRLFMLAKNIKVGTSIDYDPSEKRVSIGFRTTVVDTSLLTDILYYILPAGCYVDYFYYKEEKMYENYKYVDRLTIILSPDGSTYRIVSIEDTYTSGNYPFGNISNTSVGRTINRSLSNLGIVGIYHEDNINASLPEYWNVSTHGLYEDSSSNVSQPTTDESED